MMMESLGFLENFCKMLNILMKDAKAYLEVNDNKFESFELSKSIK